MAKTQVKSENIGDGDGVKRPDVNINTPGSALIRKAIAGNGIHISQDGVDDGTGDVTINMKDQFFVPLVYNNTTVNNWLRFAEAGVVTHQAPVMVEKTYYLKKLFFNHRDTGSVGQVCRIQVHRVDATTDLTNIGTGDPEPWAVRSDDTGVSYNYGNAEHWAWVAPDESYILEPGYRYAFRVERVTGTTDWNDIHCSLYFEEVIP